MDTTEHDDENFVPGSFGCHEAFHTASIIAEMIDSTLCNHPSIIANPEWQAMADEAREKVFALYTRIAAVHNTPMLQTRAVNYYVNDEMEERACDYCQQPYRGPAVYCSLKCAEADA